MIDDTLTMIPGPTPVHRRVLDALAQPTPSHLAPHLVAAYRQALADFRAIGQSTTAAPFIVPGSGTLAMEMALVNLAAAGDRVLVLSQGYFGDRYAELAGAFGIEAVTLRSEWGRAVTPAELANALTRGGPYTAVTITHVDTSTGTRAPVSEYCELLADRDELVILDGVCATGGVEERFDEWGLDVLLTAPQKAIAAPPGLAMCLVSQRAMARRQARESVPAYSADLLRWLPVMEDPGSYFSTPPVNEILAVAEGLRMAVEEGLVARFARHASNARTFRAGLAALGLELFTDADARADTLSVVRYPAGIDDAAFRREMAARGVVVAGALGPIAGSAFRVGHMGAIGTAEIATTLEAVEGSLRALCADIPPGTALAAAAMG